MSSEQNIARHRHLIEEVFNQRNPAITDHLFAPDYHHQLAHFPADEPGPTAPNTWPRSAATATTKPCSAMASNGPSRRSPGTCAASRLRPHRPRRKHPYSCSTIWTTPLKPSTSTKRGSGPRLESERDIL